MRVEIPWSSASKRDVSTNDLFSHDECVVSRVKIENPQMQRISRHAGDTGPWTEAKFSLGTPWVTISPRHAVQWCLVDESVLKHVLNRGRNWKRRARRKDWRVLGNGDANTHVIIPKCTVYFAHDSSKHLEEEVDVCVDATKRLHSVRIGLNLLRRFVTCLIGPERRTFVSTDLSHPDVSRMEDWQLQISPLGNGSDADFRASLKGFGVRSYARERRAPEFVDGSVKYTFVSTREEAEGLKLRAQTLGEARVTPRQ